jgi:hypothetical protein
MAYAFVNDLFLDLSVTKVQIDPSPENERAIQSYARAGFQPQRVVNTPDGPALLMVCCLPRKLILRHCKDPEVRPGLVLRPNRVAMRLAKVRREVNDSLQ